MTRNHRDQAEDEHATARPLAEDERAQDFDGRWNGGALRRVPRPDADGFTVPVDADDEPPIAAMFDSYEDTDEAGA